MIKTLFVLAFAFLTSKGLSQAITPGDVRGVSFWYVTDSNSKKQSFRNKLAANSEVVLQNAPSPIDYLNGYPSLSFSDNSRLSIDLGNTDLARASFFTVYKPKNLSSENIIWHTKKDDKADLVFTSSRMADLSIYKYMNYQHVVPLNPKVHSYIQKKESDSIIITSQILTLGAKPGFPALPISGFKGSLPEIIIYDRVLDWEEQLKVSSYLALKYGITLSEPGGSYLNSSGEQIWDGISYSDFHNNIAGICRDDSSGLLQNKASSSNDPELLTVSSRDSLVNKNFLIFGDNAKPLITAEKIPGTPDLLQRKWLVVSHGITGPIHVDLSVDTKQMDVELPIQPIYWLAIDRTGTNDFDWDGTEYIKMSSIDANGKVQFNNIFLNRTVAKNEVLGIVVAQDVLAANKIISPTCIDPNSGELKIKLFGGAAPFDVQIIKNGLMIERINVSNYDPVTIRSISAGQYKIKIIDSRHSVYTDEFYVNNSDAPRPNHIATNYLVQEGHQLNIDASNQMPTGLEYEWLGPGNFHSFTPDVSIKNDGIYTLKTSKGDCRFLQEIKVLRPPKSIFKNIKIYPNPSNGVYTVKISLDRPTAVTVAIYAADGRQVAARQLSRFANYTYTDELTANGLYYLVFTTGLSRQTEKLIIIK